MYDGNGSPIGFMCCETADTEDEPHSFDVYYYEKNLQGDVIAVRDVTGAVRYSYYYNAWGELVYAYAHNGAENTTARYNTIFYRGYYFDSDLYLYYLTTRYYDPYIGRFISADDVNVITASPMALTDKNLYAYCDNNPVMRVDYGGEFWWIAIAVTAVLSFAYNLATELIEESKEETVEYENAFISAFINTAEDVATVMFPTAAPYISASSNAVDTLVDNLIDEDNSHKVAGEIISETIVSAAIGFFDGVSVRPQEITSDMGWKKVVSEARKDYLSGIVPDWFKEVFQDFLLDRCI